MWFLALPLQVTKLQLKFHIVRKSSFYFWKALLPLYMLAVLALTSFHFDTDALDARSGTVATYFLAAFAMLYVVGDTLPKTDFLTKIGSLRLAMPHPRDCARAKSKSDTRVRVRMIMCITLHTHSAHGAFSL